MKIIKKILFFSVVASSFVACTKLDEKLNDTTAISGSAGSSSVDPKALLEKIYSEAALMGTFEHERQAWGLQEHTSDELVGPTRGGDWDDNGVFRELHAHTWRLDHAYITQTFSNLGQLVYQTTEIMGASNATTEQKAQARMLRAFASFYLVEGWNVVPVRAAGGDPLANPKVYKGTEAMDWIIKEAETALADLSENGTVATAIKPNKNATRALLMKCYLMKGVIANRKSPTYTPADMNKVIEYGNAITGYTLTSNYFDNFAPTNDVLSTENIFTIKNEVGIGGQNQILTRWYCTVHYNQFFGADDKGSKLGGWNGFTTLSDFYDKFDATGADKRRGAPYLPMTEQTGTRMGFLVGDQKDKDGVMKLDRGNNPLSYTREVKLVETGNNLEVTGIRVLKYVPDPAAKENKPANDYVIYRYADVLLMLAEANFRGVTTPITATAGATPQALVDAVRVRSGLATGWAVTLDNLLDERGRELYWEGFRRMDLLRWGKFLSAKQLKPAVSDEKRLIFPFSEQQLAANPNLTQNPGY